MKAKKKKGPTNQLVWWMVKKRIKKLRNLRRKMPQRKYGQLICQMTMLSVLYVVMMILMKSGSVVIFVILGITLDA